MTAPLSHIRILDLSRVLAGPWATQNLGDLGAEIIKVEKPGAGDDTRGYGPPFTRGADGQPTTDAVYFLTTNRNKKSIEVDIATPEGQDIVRRLAAVSDVVVENYKVGTLARYGLAWDDLRQVNPRLVYASITGFGQDGPYASRPGYDLLFQAMAGVMSVTGEPDGVPGGGPQKVGIAVADMMTGMYTALAISAALTHCERTGEGQHIDIALMDTMVAFASNAALSWLHAGVVAGRWGTAHPQVVPYQRFETADGHLVLCIGSDSQWASFCRAAGRTDLGGDPRYATNAGRVQHREPLLAALTAELKTRSKRDWQALLDAASVPCGPINNLREVFEEPQVRHRGLHIELPHAAAGQVPGVASPMRLSATPVDYRRGPPLLGQHTDEVLRGLLGLGEADIAALRAAAVI
ncbi:MAG: CaiB/BaiF CoA transferase family protein [Aquabacterium sp.]